MSAASMLPMRPQRLRALLLGVGRDWLREDAPILGYLFKVLLACLLAMWLSLRFELDQPRTAMLTVAIVMQFRAGMVFAKSYYRLLGTVVGILVSFLLVALFAQERVLFLACMALWIGLCTAGSMVFRNHQSYAFVLAGYTLCIVGLPATLNPALTFSIGVTRISEILIGLLCATVVSDLVFPQRIWDAMLQTVRRRFQDFSDLLRTTARDPALTSASNTTLLRFVSDIFSLESFRASAGLENDESRQHRLHLNRMNHDFMEVSTSFHALEQLLRRQRSSGHPQVSTALQRFLGKLGEALTLDGRSARTEYEALQIQRQLAALHAEFPAISSVAHGTLSHDLQAADRLDFDTGTELIQRLTQELLDYARSYAALATPSGTVIRTTQSEPPPQLEMHFDPVAVALAGVRGASALILLALVWIATDWRSGLEAITIGVITSTLFATSPTPTRTIKQFFTGAVLGTLLGYFCNFHLLTQAQGYWMLALAISPGIVLATWLTTRPSTAIVGAGTFIVYLMHIGFNSGYSANPVIFMNDAIADLLAVLLSGVMYGLIDLSNSRWSRQRTARALRQLVVAACRELLALRRDQLETAARDLVQRAGSTQRVATPEDRTVIDWLLSVLEIGHAVIAVRELLDGIDEPAVSAALSNGLQAIAALYDDPTAPHRAAAIAAIDRALAMLAATGTEHRLLTTTLHFIHSALLDEESVLAAGTRPQE